MARIQNFDSFGAVFPHFCRNKRKIHSAQSTPLCEILQLLKQCVVAPLERKNPFLDHRKRNTGTAALDAGLLVMSW